MGKSIGVCVIFAVLIFGIDQYIKSIFLDGFVWHSDVISFYFVLNKGVAFSMFAFLGESLKYIQIAIILGLLAYAYTEREFFKRNAIAVGILFGSGCGNILDRFLHGGVVDYVAWHYGFEFAVFNFADVMIDFAIILIVLTMFLGR
ncbi:MAG: signal peptidase II, partial [Campylobacteraceae bacterium]|nr:signal peptidase II [Campylobacteraceae bacterium]